MNTKGKIKLKVTKINCMLIMYPVEFVCAGAVRQCLHDVQNYKVCLIVADTPPVLGQNTRPEPLTLQRQLRSILLTPSPFVDMPVAACKNISFHPKSSSVSQQSIR